MNKWRLLVMVMFSVLSEINAQDPIYFEGEITYSINTVRKDSSYDLSNVLTYPADTIKALYKNGDWIHRFHSKLFEYYYFNHVKNREYWKINVYDTLLGRPGEFRGGAKEDSLISTQILLNTDTILGLVCNRLILRTYAATLTLIFSPQIRTNPDWYELSKLNYYDVVYRNMKSYYLKMIWETNQFVSTFSAVYLKARPVSVDEFPDLNLTPVEMLSPSVNEK
jgi:hypothetical protein